MIRCPFYGFRWPERNPVLRYVGGNECGLDLGRHEACAMEVEKRQVDFFACPVAVEQRHMLYPANTSSALSEMAAPRGWGSG
jgi:hypothetical protein